MQRPRNTVVLRGENATLRCQTNTSSSSSTSAGSRRPTAPSWKFTDVNGRNQKFVYNAQGLSPTYSDRGVTVDVNSATGEYHLVFSSADLQDAGTYTCQDGDGDGDAHAAWMAVLGQFMQVPVRFCAENTASDGRTYSIFGRIHTHSILFYFSVGYVGLPCATNADSFIAVHASPCDKVKLLCMLVVPRFTPW